MRCRRAALWIFVLVVACGVIGAGVPVGAAPAVGLIEGVVAVVDASSLTVTPRSGGAVRIAITPDTRIIKRQGARLEEIKPRDFVGVTARRETDGSLTAVSINIFPPEFKERIRQTQFPMESGNIMTNALVFQSVRRVDGRTLYLSMPDGTAVISVPTAAEIFRLTVIRVADVRQGMRVSVRTTTGADGGMVATTVTVDEAR